MSKLTKFTTSFAWLFIPFFAVEKAYADEIGGNVPFNGEDLPDVIYKFFGWAISLAGIVFVVMFLVGGIQYLTSAGNEEASTKAKKLLVDAVIGIVIVAIAYVAGTWLLQQIGVDVLI
jgi:small-conductance mechanosensitive channel